MKRAPFLAAFAALLAACATQGGFVSSEWSSTELARGVKHAAELERSGDLRGARAELDRALALVPQDRLAPADARALDARLAIEEVRPFEGLFDELAGALERREHDAAGRILARIEARGPVGAAARRAEGFRNILDGRATAAALGLSLEARATGAEGEFEILLRANPQTETAVHMRCPGASLVFSSLGTSEAGIESRARRRVLTDALADLELEPQVEVEIRLGTFYVPVRGLVAARGRWELITLGGGIVRDGRELPANAFRAGECEVLRLDPRLPVGEVAPQEFAAYVERGAPSLPALLERAARLAPSRRAEALDLATPAFLRLLTEDLERLAPALRFLTLLEDPPQDPAGWRAWFEARARTRSRGTRPKLDLPERGSEALRAQPNEP